MGYATKFRTLRGLCDGADVVFSSLGIRSLSPKPTFWDVDFRANMNVLEWAVRAGVKHFIFVSVLHGDEIRAQVPVAEARERVVDALKASGLTWTVLRPTGFFNDMAEIFGMVRQLGLNLVVGDGASLINPIHGADTAEQVVRAVADPALHNRAVPLGGPDTFTFKGLGELAGEVLGREPRLLSLPMWSLRLAETLAKPFSTNAAGLLKASELLFDVDGVGPPVGTHHLRDFFEELKAESEAKDSLGGVATR